MVETYCVGGGHSDVILVSSRQRPEAFETPRPAPPHDQLRSQDLYAKCEATVIYRPKIYRALAAY